MSREIKFRVWDGKEMHYVDGKSLGGLEDRNNKYLIIDGSGWSVHWGFELTQQNKRIVTDCFMGGTLMQYTGLKDKNGKEICEGDILKLAESNERTAAFAARKLEESTPYCEYLFSVEVAEIIGNIYQNPELINN